MFYGYGTLGFFAVIGLCCCTTGILTGSIVAVTFLLYLKKYRRK